MSSKAPEQNREKITPMTQEEYERLIAVNLTTPITLVSLLMRLGCI